MLAFVLIVIIPFHPIDLDAIGPRYARHLDGKPVIASLIAGKPPWKFMGSTIIGTADTPDGSERIPIQIGKWPDVKEGRRVTVVGVLRVIEHPVRRIGREVVPPWVEIRVEQ
jgi:hypothetical protein